MSTRISASDPTGKKNVPTFAWERLVPNFLINNRASLGRFVSSRAKGGPPRGANSRPYRPADLLIMKETEILGAHALDHTDACGRWDDFGELEASRVEQRAELIFRALPAARADQHVNVIGGRTPTFVRRIDAQRIDALDDKQPTAGTHRATAVL